MTFAQKYKCRIIGILVACILMLIILFTTGGLEKVENISDTSYAFNKAIIYMGGEWITVNIAFCKSYSNSEQVYIKSTSGEGYLIHTLNVILVEEG